MSETVLATLRKIVRSIRGDDAHNSHGGDSAASHSEDTDTEPTSEYQAVRAAAKRAAQYEDDRIRAKSDDFEEANQ